MRATWLVLPLLLAPIAARAAPSCPPGQAVTPDTQGHCCWPNQAWSVTRAVCVGLPACPPGTTPEGEQCRAVPAPSSVPVLVPPPPPPPLPPPTTTAPAAPPGLLLPPPPPLLEAPTPPGAAPAYPAPAPPPEKKPKLERSTGTMVAGAVLLGLGLIAAGTSIPFWQDALDDGQLAPNKRFSGHDGIALGEAIGLDLLGLVGVTVGVVLLPMGARLRPVDAPQAFTPQSPPIQGRVAKLEVALAF